MIATGTAVDDPNNATFVDWEVVGSEVIFPSNSTTEWYWSENSSNKMTPINAINQHYISYGRVNIDPVLLSKRLFDLYI